MVMNILALNTIENAVFSLLPVFLFLLFLGFFFWLSLKRRKTDVNVYLDAMTKNTEAMDEIGRQLKRIADATERKRENGDG